jgi:hypothetical protein
MGTQGPSRVESASLPSWQRDINDELLALLS